MLSVSRVNSASSASHYFQKDNYYAKDDAASIEASNWYGEGANLLGLQGNVEPELFKQLLSGELPNGETLGRINQGVREHRPGYDLTFSAPKSVSLLALMGSDKRLLDAHSKAVNITLQAIESEIAQARKTLKGDTTYENTGNLTIAKFNHDVSRALDPQLHTHAIVLNMTQRQDGKWRALATDSQYKNAVAKQQGFIEQIYGNKMYWGSYYRNSLAYHVKALGYEIEHKPKSSLFEIAGISTDVLTHFSKRRTEIKHLMTELDMQGGKAAATATLMTRDKKNVVDREVLHASWQERSTSINFLAKALVDNAKLRVRTHDTPNVNKALLRDTVLKSIANNTEREAVFSKRNIIEASLKRSLGHFQIRDIDSAIKQLVQEKALICENTALNRYTTPEMIHKEHEILATMHDQKDTVKPISISPETFLFSKENLTAGQFQAAKMILTSKDRYVGVQGYAGTGKTTLLNTIKEVFDIKSINMLGIAPSGNAADEITKSTGMHAKTLAYFLTLHNDKAVAKNTVIVADEASMISTRDMLSLFNIVNRDDLRLILLGDKAQLGAIDAGKPFHQLQQAGMQTAVMQEILRQKNPKLREAIYDLIDRNTSSALQKLGNNFHEVSHKEERLAAVATHYLSLSKKERTQTLVLSPANKDRIKMSDLIRQGLKTEGELGHSMGVDRLVNKHLTCIEKSEVRQYALGGVIRFGSDLNIKGIKRGDYATVVSRTTHELILKKSDNTMITLTRDEIEHLKNTEVYERVKSELSVGDKIRWARNDKEKGVKNNNQGVITDINQSSFMVNFQDKGVKQFSLNELPSLHWDHAYVNTIYASQGKTTNRVIAMDESFQHYLTNQQSFYVMLSRAKLSVDIYTDDKTGYAKLIANNLGEKSSALDINNNGTYKDKIIDDENNRSDPKMMNNVNACEKNELLHIANRSNLSEKSSSKDLDEKNHQIER